MWLWPQLWLQKERKERLGGSGLLRQWLMVQQRGLGWGWPAMAGGKVVAAMDGRESMGVKKGQNGSLIKEKKLGKKKRRKKNRGVRYREKRD